MAEFLLGRIKFVWKNEWSSSVAYVKDDVVRYGGKVYICTTAHTSQSDFYTDITNWNVFADGQSWKGDWLINTYYKVGDVVKYGGYLYISKNGHTSADTITKGLEFNAGDWDTYAEFFNYRNDWSVSTRYRVNDIVKYGGTVYVCVDDHTSNASSNTDSDGLESDNDGRVLTLDNISNADSNRAQGTYNNITPTGGSGTGLEVQAVVDNIGGVAITLTSNGSNYVVGDQLSIPDSSLGGGGGATLTFTVGTVADRWNIFSEGFDWKDVWVAETRYKLNDLVKYGGQIYVCITGHRSGTLSQGLEADQAKWQHFHKGVEYRQNWTVGTRYRVNDIVKNGGGIWICTGHHTAGNTFEADESNWSIFVPGLQFENSWNNSSIYQPGDLVTYGGYSYISLTNHQGRPPYSNASDWQLYLKGYNFVGDYQDDSTNQDYKVGDVIRHGGYTFMCIQDHSTAQDPATATTYWTKLNEGFNWKGDWTNITDYLLGDVVYYGVNSYVVVQAHQSNQAIGNKRPDLDSSGTYYKLLAGGAEGSNLTTDGDILYYGGGAPTRLPIGAEGQILTVDNSTQLPAWAYWGRTDHVYYVGPNGIDGTYPGYGSTLDRPYKTIRFACEAIEKGVLRPNATQLLKENRQFIQRETVEWVDNQIANTISPFTGSFTYNKDKCYRDTGIMVDAVIWDLSHGGNTESRKVAYSYFTKAGASYVNGQEAETVAALNYAKTVIDAVISSVDPAANYQTLQSYTPAISQRKNLTLVEETNAQSIINSLFAIVTNAITADSTANIPAEEQVQKTVFVKTGAYKEVLPIRVPANTAVVGDELRSTKVQPSLSTDYTQRSDVPYSVAGITRLRAVLSDIIQGNAVTKTASNTQTQVQALPYGTATEGTSAQGKLQHIIDYINYYAGNDTQDSTAPTMTTGQSSLSIQSITKANPCVIETTTAHGLYDRALINVKSVDGMIQVNDRMFYVDVLTSTTFALYEDFKMVVGHDSTNHETYTANGTIYYNGNVRSADQNVHNAVRQLYLNKEFLAEEVTAYIQTTYPAYTFSADSCKDDVRDYIDAVIHDITYGGTYSSHYAARFYANAVEGSLTEDMFYLRNGCGLRNCSLNGLTGVLGAANSYGTKRPTAGAFTSLDPGWGPADERTYIINKSPYVQNVSNFGTAAIGLKVDGALHDSGNDSIVANDYTQIISDGIGCWITNLGRSELVSVFSYYGHIGYLAENGGKIRATNGNSSYGTYGTVAEGVDATETAIAGKVNNRYSEALVDSVMTDAQEIVTMFFNNAGVNYTDATFTIAGDGAGASAFADEFRDQALFAVRMLNTDLDADGTGDFGGANYAFAENTAQTGDATTIRLSNTDTANTGDYNGMRIVITNGLGVGQYGYIGTYNAGNKNATVYRESDDEPGFDHFITGTPISNLLDGTTKYIVEPRVKIGDPPYSSTSQSIGTALQNNRQGIAYGNDRFIIVGKSTNQGLYSTNGATWISTGLLPTNGNWNGLHYGKKAADSTMTWICLNEGTNNGAYSTDDGLSWTAMTLTSTTDWKSTTYGKDKFVIVSTGNTTGGAAYSADGITWTASNLGGAGSQNYHKVIFGKNEFIAITDGAQYSQSTDGINWNSKALPAFTDTRTKVKDIAWGNGRYLVIGDRGTEAFYSFDGSNWSVTAVDSTADSSIGGGDGLLEYGMGAFLWLSATNGQLRTVTNIGVADALRSAGTYTIGASDYTTGSALGANAEFEITVDGTGAATITVLESGSRWVAGDTITVADAQLGSGGGAALTFDVGTVFDTSQAAVSKDGVNWLAKTNGVTNGVYAGFAFGNPEHRPTWFATQSGSATGSLIRAGATALVRAVVATGKIARMIIQEPGSGYSVTPTITITDPNNTIEAPVQLRIGDGALGNPTILIKGTGYETASATLTGDGTIDKFQGGGSNIFVKDLTEIPKAGSNVTFNGLNTYFKLVVVRELQGPVNGLYSAKLQVSPNIPVDTAPAHDTDTELRIRYSQVRLTGHDFLDIGTGNFADTNYPNLPYNNPNPANETVQGGGGRVFFTSTDQDGNFRVGDLFSVEQSTGVATLDADAFNVAGLNELSLGSVELGGTGAVITEFSTDGTFAADSDSIVPTQKAIRTFINAQIGGGNSELNVNILTAGVIEIKENQIDTTTDVEVRVKAKMNFTGGVDGDAVALQRFLLS